MFSTPSISLIHLSPSQSLCFPLSFSQFIDHFFSQSPCACINLIDFYLLRCLFTSNGLWESTRMFLVFISAQSNHEQLNSLWHHSFVIEMESIVKLLRFNENLLQSSTHTHVPFSTRNIVYGVVRPLPFPRRHGKHLWKSILNVIENTRKPSPFPKEKHFVT